MHCQIQVAENQVALLSQHFGCAILHVCNGKLKLAACSFGWWLMAGAGLFLEKSTAGWLLVADLF
jgi:hypothetical protein